jgi:hypothetical protein
MYSRSAKQTGFAPTVTLKLWQLGESQLDAHAISENLTLYEFLFYIIQPEYYTNESDLFKFKPVFRSFAGTFPYFKSMPSPTKLNIC